MKKHVVLIFAFIMIFGLLFISGCGDGDSSNSDTGGEEVVVDVTEPVSEGIYGEYNQKDGEGKVSLYNDGSFTTGTGIEGDFEIKEDSFLELAYDDGKKETWSIMIGDGKVAAIVNPEGEQYDKTPE